MQLQAVCCNNCGAPLDVPPSAKFLLCQHCGSRLAIKRSATTVFTEVLGQIEHHTATIADHTGLIRLKTEVEVLEKDYLEKKAAVDALPELKSQGENEGVMGIGCGLVGIISIAVGGVGGWIFGGMAFVCAAIFAVAMTEVGKQVEKRKKLEATMKKAKAEYERRRMELMAQVKR